MTDNRIEATNGLFFKELSADPALQPALQVVRERLQTFAGDPNFTGWMQLAFGEGIEIADLQDVWAGGSLGALPEIEVRPAAEINGARGAFATATNTIYLAQELLSESVEQVARVFLEEYGHYVDSLLTPGDAPGDEGAIFAEVVRGNELGSSDVAQLKAEDDTATVLLDGKEVAIEQVETIDQVLGFTASDIVPLFDAKEYRPDFAIADFNESGNFVGKVPVTGTQYAEFDWVFDGSFGLVPFINLGGLGRVEELLYPTDISVELPTEITPSSNFSINTLSNFRVNPSANIKGTGLDLPEIGIDLVVELREYGIKNASFDNPAPFSGGPVEIGDVVFNSNKLTIPLGSASPSRGISFTIQDILNNSGGSGSGSNSGSGSGSGSGSNSGSGSGSGSGNNQGNLTDRLDLSFLEMGVALPQSVGEGNNSLNGFGNVGIFPSLSASAESSPILDIFADLATLASTAIPQLPPVSGELPLPSPVSNFLTAEWTALSAGPRFTLPIKQEFEFNPEDIEVTMSLNDGPSITQSLGESFNFTAPSEQSDVLEIDAEYKLEGEINIVSGLSPNLQFDVNALGFTFSIPEIVSQDVGPFISKTFPEGGAELAFIELFDRPIDLADTDNGNPTIELNYQIPYGDGPETIKETDLTQNGNQIGVASLELPTYTTDGEVDYTVTLSSAGQDVLGQFNFAYIIDTSGSVSGTALDNAQDAFTNLTNFLINEGIAANSTFTVIPFSDDATLTDPLSPNDAINEIQSLSAFGSTNYNAALNKANEFFSGLSTGAENIAYFLSDGAPNVGGNFRPEADALQDVAEVRAFGIGGADLNLLNEIDSGDDPVERTTSADLADEFAQSGFSVSNISEVNILLDGTVVETILPSDFQDAALGQTFSGTLSGLDTSDSTENQVTAEVILSSGQTSTIDFTVTSGQGTGTATSGDDRITLGALDTDVDAGDGNDTIIGNYLNNTIRGGLGNDRISASGGNDTIHPDDSPGDDRVDGGEGTDTVVYPFARSEASIQKPGDVILVNSSTGKDTLTNVEYIQFSDQRISTQTLDSVPFLSVSDITVTEGDAGTSLAQFSLNLSSAANSDVVVSYATEDDRATAGSDYNSASGQITIPSGETSATIEVEIIGDTTFEPNQEFSLELSNLSGATFNDNEETKTVSALIEDNDNPAFLSIEATDSFLQEGDSGTTPFTFTVTRSDNTTGEVEVSYEVVGNGNNPADANDFGGTLPSGTVTFADGETEKQITINVSGDNEIEGNERFGVNLSNPSAGAVVTGFVPTATIGGDDNTIPTLENPIPNQVAPKGESFNFPFPANTFVDPDPGDRLTYTASLANGDPLPDWLNFDPATRTFSGTPTEDNRGTIAIEITATDSFNIGTVESFELTVPPTTVRIESLDNPSESGPTAGQFQLNLTEPAPTGGVTVNYSVAGTATEGEDYEALSGSIFVEGGETSATIDVVPFDDAIAEGDETVELTLQTGENYQLGDSTTTTLTIIDNDTAGVTVSPTSGDTNENGTTATFDFVLDTQPTADVTVELTNTEPSEGTLSTNSLTFTPDNWNQPQTVTVTGIDDAVADGNTEYQIETLVSSADSNYDGLDPSDVTIVNVDKDSPNVLIDQSEGNTFVTEGGEPDTYEVELTTRPTADVTIDIETDEQIQATDSLTFTPDNWDTPQTVTVNAVDDEAVEDKLTSTISHTVTSDDTDYNEIGVGDIRATVADNDLTAVSIESVTDATEKNSTTGTFELTLSNPAPVGGLTVNYSVGGSATEGEDYNPLKSEIFIAAGQTSVNLNVVPIDDRIVDADETVEVTLESGSGYELGTSTTASLTIVDNDTEPAIPATEPEGISSLPPLPDTDEVETEAEVTDTTDTESTAFDFTTTAEVEPTEPPASPLLPEEVSESDIPFPNPNAVTRTFTGTLESDRLIGTFVAEALHGFAGNDFIKGMSAEDNLFGGTGFDILHGNQGNDFLDGGTGDDTLHAGKQNDALLGRKGNDLLFGNRARDIVLGGTGNDFLNGNQGDDTVKGGAGDDTIHGGQDDDLLNGNLGADLVRGDNGDDNIFGEQGNDFLNGNQGNDTLNGGEGDDVIRGGKDDDFLFGTAGEDWLFGDFGADILSGGADRDRFVLQADMGTDVITDFADGVDLIGLGEGMTFDQLAIAQSDNATVLSMGDKVLAALNGVDATLITQDDFFTVG
ncbi:Calx-beta domain-containing protein [Phormidium sp. CCY1219]|uniref:Calx-beta domain-containing protein n=1 Tax=Phormidium sp. CCY1219 TaxID=2886104 RepID=UPI002D1F361E|nr:Calx-beta domain-containing protein [Phormidium sp. CCY1219]MEB3827610.1 putative Ig domain-containing protein [Phormidium sp. CCY1219]